MPSPVTALLASRRSAALASHTRSTILTYSSTSQHPPPPPPRSRQYSANSDSVPPPPPSRWLADIRARVGKCILFGCSSTQLSSISSILSTTNREWRELTAGSEAFLAGSSGGSSGVSDENDQRGREGNIAAVGAKSSGKRGLDKQQVVWGEMDSFQHVNNVNYLRYAESSRVNWARQFAVEATNARERKSWAELMTPKSVGLIMKSLKVDFKFPITYPDHISVYHKLRHPPSKQPDATAILLDCIILSHKHRRIAARVEENVVIYDYKAGKKTEMPSFMQHGLEKTFEAQQESMVAARTKVWQLLSDVERLEKETWDREDAVEDLGGASTK